MLPTTATHLATIRSTAIAADNSGGAPRLGNKTWIDGEKQDTTLFYVDSAGALLGSFSYGPQQGATDVEVKHLANTGPITMTYVANETGATLQRGTAIKAATSGIFEVEQAVAGATTDPLLVGVLPFDLEDGKACYAFTSGTVPASIDAAVTVGDLLVQGAGGVFTNTGATAANATAIAAETTAGAAIASVVLISGKTL
jgi:hypothetical protein